jgi:hypothetical protein
VPRVLGLHRRIQVQKGIEQLSKVEYNGIPALLFQVTESSSKTWRDRIEAECGRLLSAYPVKVGSRVRIPLPPPSYFSNLFFANIAYYRRYTLLLFDNIRIRIYSDHVIIPRFFGGKLSATCLRTMEKQMSGLLGIACRTHSWHSGVGNSSVFRFNRNQHFFDLHALHLACKDSTDIK